MRRREEPLRKKLYYSIKEVAAYFDVNESLLRFWEKEFPHIKPKTNRAGTRKYQKEDIEKIQVIYHLVKERGLTLSGAKQRLKHNKELTNKNFEVVKSLKSIRNELAQMIKELEKSS